MDIQLRSNRKLDHIYYALALKEKSNLNGFKDITLVPASLPELNWSEVDPSCTFLGKTLRLPLLINAMTGGHPDVLAINRGLARASCQMGIAMAVGSQKAGLVDPALYNTYSVVREENPDGVILANLSASCLPDEASAAIHMIAADGIQLYLNASQELAMTEGDRQFRGVLKNIARIKASVAVPLIVKEVGFGMPRETMVNLREAGVDFIDVGGWGGTNFFEIETLRRGEQPEADLLSWGIPTAVCLLEGLNLNPPVPIIACGGISTALDIAKALSLGACLVGIARHFLKFIIEEKEVGLIQEIYRLEDRLRTIMLLVGTKTVKELAEKPYIVTGRTGAWIKQRGLSLRRT